MAFRPGRESALETGAFNRTHLIMLGDAIQSVHILHWDSTWPVVDQLSSRLAAVLALPSENLANPVPRSETRTVTASQGHSDEPYRAYVHGTTRDNTQSSKTIRQTEPLCEPIVRSFLLFHVTPSTL